MYQELKGNENFSDKYATWVIAYCLDTDSFFATNQRHFFWEYNDEFQCENDAINYFRNHLNEFRNAKLQENVDTEIIDKLIMNLLHAPTNKKALSLNKHARGRYTIEGR